MSNPPSLQSLNVLEIHILLGHIKLGEPHLKKYLSKQQFNELLALGSLKEEQSQNIKTCKAEKSGTVALVLNTIITSVFGAWMGFSGFMGLSLNSIPVLVAISGLALLLSGLVGYYSFSLTHNTAHTALINQQLHNLQVKLLELCREKKQEQIDKLTEYLTSTLRKLDESQLLHKLEAADFNYRFDSADNITDWLNDINQIIQHKIKLIESEQIYGFYGERLRKITRHLKKVMSENIMLKENLPEVKQKPVENTHAAKDALSFIEVLTDPNIVAPKEKVKRRSWLRDNFISIAVGLVPTILGGFASMFVFLSGGPNLAKDLGQKSLETLLRQPNARSVEFAIAISLTLYYGFSSLYNNRKAYVRAHTLEQTRTRIANRDAELIELNAKFNILEKAKVQLLRINNIYTALAKIAPYWETAKQELNKYTELLKKAHYEL